MSNSKEVALKVDHVEKYFKLPTEHSSEIKQVFINWTRGIKGYKKQKVLKGISFTVNKGDFFGIVGRNGSGKSTLLKVISGIYPPNNGKVEINGTLIPFIELGVGFNPELTGRENVYLNGAMLGFSEKQIDAMYDDIVDFAELWDFMDQKLKNYSSGMQVRLAFSVAIKAHGDILVLDEVLAVGDEAFQKKCNDYFFDAKRNGKTIILVTHDMGAVRQFCNRAIFINNGKIEAEGDPNMVANKYSGLFRKEYIEKLKKETGKTEKELRIDSNSGIELDDIKIKQKQSDKWRSVKLIDFRKPYEISLKLRSKKRWSNVVVRAQIVDKSGKIIHIFTTRQYGVLPLGKAVSISYKSENVLSNGDYAVNVLVHNDEKGSSYEELLKVDEALKFTVVGQDVLRYSTASLTHPEYYIDIN